MKRLVIRVRRIREYGETTLGKLTIDGVAKSWYVLEPGGPDSKVDGSDKRITAGRYKLKSYSSKRYLGVYEVKNVPGRTKILMHAGNYHQNTEGCLMPGKSFSTLPDNHYRVMHSKKALQEIFSIIDNYQDINIIITNAVVP